MRYKHAYLDAGCVLPDENLPNKAWRDENRKYVHVGKHACTALWGWFIWLPNLIILYFYIRHMKIIEMRADTNMHIL